MIAASAPQQQLERVSPNPCYGMGGEGTAGLAPEPGLKP